VRTVDLHARKASALHQRCRAGEASDDCLDLVRLERARLRKTAEHPHGGDRRRRDGLARHDALNLAAGVVELREHVRAVLTRRDRPRRELREERVVLDDHVAHSLEVTRVDLDVAREQEAAAAAGPRSVERLEARRRPSRDLGQSFAHRGLREAVLQGELASGQRQRGVDQRCSCRPWGRMNSSHR